MVDRYLHMEKLDIEDAWHFQVKSIQIGVLGIMEEHRISYMAKRNSISTD